MADEPFDKLVGDNLVVNKRLGIGISEPATQLHIATAATEGISSQVFVESINGSLLKVTAESNSASIGTENAFPLSIQTDGVPRIVISGTGNITITESLTVQNSLTVTGNTNLGTDTTPANLQVKGNVTANAFLGNGTALSGLVKQAGDTMIGPLTVQANLSVSGNVSIGTTSSSYKLAIAAGDINIDDGRALRQAGRWIIGGDSSILSIGSSDKSDGRDIRLDPGFAGALTVKKDTGHVGIGTANPQEKLHIASGGIKVSATTIAASGIEVVREVLPLVLESNNNYVDINGGWTPITKTVYGVYGNSVYASTIALPGSQRKYKLVIRNANNGIQEHGHISRYRLFYSWANQADNKEYDGSLYWGLLDEGAWDTVILDHVVNPSGQNSYWRLEGYTSGCVNRVFNVSIQIIDIIQ